MGDRLSTQLRHAIRAALEAPDRAVPFSTDSRESVLSLETLGNVAAIVHEARDRLVPGAAGAEGVDLEAVYLAGCFHMARLRLLPEGGQQEAQREWDGHACTFLLSIVHAVRPESVPGPLRSLFATSPPPLQPASEVLHAVAMVLFVASTRARDKDRLWQAAAMIQDAIEAAPAGGADPGITFNLGSALAELFALTGDRELILAATVHMRRAVAVMRPERASSPTVLRALAAAQAEAARTGPPNEADPANAVAHYMRDGQPDRLDALIDGTRRTLQDTALTEPDRTKHRISLGNALRMRFEVGGDLDDLAESISSLQEVADTSHDEAARRLAASWLALSHLVRFVDSRDRADLDRATALGRSSLSSSDALSPAHGQTLTNLAAVLHTRFNTYGDPEDLDEAVRHLEHAVAVTPTHQHDRPIMRIKLAAALRDRAAVTGNDVELERAAALLLEVARHAPADGPSRQLAHLELGHVLFKASGGTGPGLVAANTQHRITALTPTHDIRTRLIAANAWGLGSALAGDLGQARQAFATALDDLLPKAAGHTLGRPSKENRLHLVESLARDAAAAEIRAGRPREALIRLEQGRGVLLAQALRLRGHTGLAARSPELAERFERVCAELVAERATADERKATAREYDRLVEEIRALPGFARFQRPPDWRRLRTAAAQGPVVVVNVSSLGCDALLLRRRRMRTTVEVVPLAGVTRDEVAARASGFLAAVAALSATGTPFAERLEHDLAVTRTLGWLGEHITGPVLARLGLDHPVRPGRMWPRVWWCPTGPLSLLPLHAARCGAGEAGWVDDRVVSSYVPTLEALLHARARPAPPRDRWSVVAVGVPEAPALDADGPVPQRLPAVEEELAAVDELPAGRSRLRGADADPQTVLAALRSHTHAHLACHGRHDPGDPSGGGLLLHGGTLTVRQLSAERMPDAEFAYLSACHTAAPGVRLVDEVITLASAFQLCGYRQVIGTLWTVADAIAPGLAREVYRAMAAAGPGGDAACALHQATRRLRAQPHYAAPLFWASAVHIGP